MMNNIKTLLHQSYTQSDILCERVLGTSLTILAGAGTGFSLQQNKQTIDAYFPGGTISAGATMNIVKSGLRDMYCLARGQDTKTVIYGDMKNFLLFNVSMFAGYYSGVLKDFLDRS